MPRADLDFLTIFGSSSAILISLGGGPPPPLSFNQALLRGGGSLSGGFPVKYLADLALISDSGMEKGYIQARTGLDREKLSGDHDDPGSPGNEALRALCGGIWGYFLRTQVRGCRQILRKPPTGQLYDVLSFSTICILSCA